MMDVLNLALPYFGLIFIGFARGKLGKLPETDLAWMNFFLLYVSLAALFFRKNRSAILLRPVPSAACGER
jgi:malonate transporter and related proteins